MRLFGRLLGDVFGHLFKGFSRLQSFLGLFSLVFGHKQHLIDVADFFDCIGGFVFRKGFFQLFVRDFDFCRHVVNRQRHNGNRAIFGGD